MFIGRSCTFSGFSSNPFPILKLDYLSFYCEVVIKSSLCILDLDLYECEDENTSSHSSGSPYVLDSVLTCANVYDFNGVQFTDLFSLRLRVVLVSYPRNDCRMHGVLTYVS